MMRISMSLPKEILNDFDEVLKERGYNSRSKGIRDALNDYILRYQWMNDMEGDRVGLITVMYDHCYTGVMEDLMDVQHDYANCINSTMRVQMTEKYFLDVIVVNGDVKLIRDLTEKVMRLKGVEHVKLTSAIAGENQ
jgi:CopG family transcriptional regulator, nickel-responsive regulator